ncbi:MAG: thiamine pyrophosphate-binding protein [bacterium]|nr:thiamine pyrophosphate-binding protein [bacterium]
MSDGTPAGIAIAEVLADAGITHVFGVPGGYSIKVFDGLRKVADRVNSVRAAHEHQASVMADMYGRLTGQPGVFTGQGPFAASSGGFGLMEGYLSGTPIRGWCSP